MFNVKLPFFLLKSTRQFGKSQDHFIGGGVGGGVGFKDRFFLAKLKRNTAIDTKKVNIPINRYLPIYTSKLCTSSGSN
jgi:hypothetical protein